MSVHRSAGAYFLVQGIAVLLWCALLLLVPSSRAPFQMPGALLLAFWLPDLALLAIGSLVAGGLTLRRSPLAGIARWLVCGAIGYASLYLVAYALLTDSAWLGALFMLPAALLSGASTVAVAGGERSLFRQARPASTLWNLAKTGVQVVVMWGVLLFLVPLWIAHMEGRVGWPHVAFPGQRPLAAGLFAGFSALGLWCGFLMTRHGAGTPLPLDSPRHLVTCGPYAHVRNPMAISGFGQGAAIAVGLGSPSALGYVLIGVWIWECLVRPLEEADLRAHFGDDYAAYCRAVRCWRPGRTPYTSPRTAGETTRGTGTV